MKRQCLSLILSLVVIAITLFVFLKYPAPWPFLILLFIPVVRLVSESLFKKTIYRIMVSYGPEGSDPEYIQKAVPEALAGVSEGLKLLFIMHQPRHESGVHLVDVSNVKREQFKYIKKELQKKGFGARIYQLNPSVTEEELKLLRLLQFFEFFVAPHIEPLKSIRVLQEDYRKSRIREKYRAQLGRHVYI